MSGYSSDILAYHLFQEAFSHFKSPAALSLLKISTAYSVTIQ